MSVQDKDRVLTSKGYAIKKSALSDIQTQGLRSELTMSPKVMDKFQKTVTSFPIYYESKTRFYVPRHWGIKQFGEPEANIVSDGLPFSNNIAFNVNFPPHDFQTEIITSFIEKGGNGLICVPCGYGKTFMALNIAVRLGKRFLIVVDKEFLMNQWKTEIQNFIQGATVGILQSGTCQVGKDVIFDKEHSLSELKQLAKENHLKTSGTKQEIIERLQMIGIDTTPKSREVHYDVTICMIQTICRQEYPDGFFDDYGFTIFDECHHLGAAYFCQALKKIQTKCMLGLSATPDREDGLSAVFEYFLGDPVYKNTKRSPDKEAVVKAVWFHSEDPVYTEVPVNWRGEPISAKLLNQIAEFEPRNQKIIQLVQEYAHDPDRFLLILSDRISQLEWIENALDALPTKYRHGYYIGGMKQSVLDENAEKCQILLATYQMASEAFSVKKLNTVVLATPRKNVEQSTGRIFRQRIEERKVAPHIIDIIDSHECYKRRWYIRQRFYKECQYTFQHIDKPVKVVAKVEGNEHGCLIQL
uniref:Helicase ATP-binding domain-containing protein n=1 Tax=viral metagenome TaxID=1070528 RepID=A0A6C0KN08_9ZZZZ